jgi:hypothetical protein
MKKKRKSRSQILAPKLFVQDHITLERAQLALVTTALKIFQSLLLPKKTWELKVTYIARLVSLALDEKVYSYKDNLKKYKVKKNMPQIAILKDEDAPPGATISDNEEESNEPNPFANINFNEPLRPEEQLPVRTHRTTVAPVAAPKEKTKGKKSKKKEEGKEKKSSKKKAAKEKAVDTGVLIDFDPISSPPSTSPALRLSGFEEVEDAPEPEKPKKKTKAKEGKTKKGTKTKEGKSTKKKEAEQPSSPAPAKPAGKFKPLCQDENLSIVSNYNNRFYWRSMFLL